jgi:hypothetical protein
MLIIQINIFAQVSACSEKNVLDSKISGESVVCSFVMNGAEKYEVEAIPGVSSYHWTVPTGVSIVEGQGTNVIYVQVDNNFNNGEISLHVSGTGISGKISKAINLQPDAPEFDLKKNTVLPNHTAIFSVEDKGETFTWEAPAGCEIISGQGSAEVKIQFGKNFKGGYVSVSANNDCGLGSMSKTFVSSTEKEAVEHEENTSILAQSEF